MLFYHCGNENEVVKGNGGILDEMLDGMYKQKIFLSNV